MTVEQNSQAQPQGQPQPSVQELQSQLAKLNQQMMAEIAERSRLAQLLQNNPQPQQPKAEELKPEEIDVKSVLEDMQVNLEADVDGTPRTVDNLSNRELLQVITQAVEGALDNVKENANKTYEKKFEELGNQYKNLQNGLTGIAAYINVSDARSRFSDFDQYRPQIGAIVEKYPNMSIQDAYVLAKANVAGNTPPVHIASSERPTNVVTNVESNRPSPEDIAIRQQQPRTTESAKLRFRNLLDKAVEAVIKKQQIVD